MYLCVAATADCLLCACNNLVAATYTIQHNSYYCVIETSTNCRLKLNKSHCYLYACVQIHSHTYIHMYYMHLELLCCLLIVLQLFSSVAFRFLEGYIAGLIVISYMQRHIHIYIHTYVHLYIYLTI